MTARPDPFALPAQTTLRFLLLVAAALGSAVFAFNLVYLHFAPSEWPLFRSCAAAAARPAGLGRRLEEAATSLAECLSPAEPRKALWVAAGLAVMVVVTAAIYWMTPAWRIRRRRLAPLRDAPELAAELDALVARAGLPRPPTFLLSTRAGASGVAFGHVGRRYVQIDAGLLVRHRLDPQAFRAVLLHELAHLRNRDLDITYLTIGIWRAFLLVAVLPLLLILADEPAVLPGVAWRLACLMTLVFLTRNAVLRSRELYADLRADGWEGSRGAIRRVIARLPAQPAARRFFATHPAPQVRLATLDDAARLFRPGFWEAFSAGVVVTVTYENLVTLIWFVVGTSDPLTTRWLAAAAFTPLAAGVVGIALWRSAAYAAALGLRPHGTWIAGAGLGAGLVLGEPLSVAAAVTGSLTASGTPGADVADMRGVGAAGFGPAGAVAALCLVGVAVLMAGWIAATARAWYPSAGSRKAALFYVPLLMASATLLALWLGLRSLLVDARHLLPHLERLARDDFEAWGQHAWPGPWPMWLVVDHPLALDLSQRDLTAVGLIALWLIPLAAPRARPSATVAVPAGLAGAFLYAVALLTARAFLHHQLPESTRTRAEFLLLAEYWHVAAAWAAQVAVALPVAAHLAARRREHPVLLACMAAFVAGALMVVAELSIISFGGCVPEFSLAPGPCAWQFTAPFVRLETGRIVTGGAAVALAAALAGLGAGKVLGALRSWWAACAGPLVLLGRALAAGVVLIVLLSGGITATEHPGGSAGVEADGTAVLTSQAVTEVCALQRRLIADLDSLSPAGQRARLTDMLAPAILADDEELQSGVLAMFDGLDASDAAKWAEGLRTVNAACHIRLG
ncbi:hypothetical protein GCM10009850_118860 [Nonomuraea monospora]|uniref:Peptidase M48 domain-containing protein n=1 Tax=Nonomuraea monospora TaxID=568818 RepID=A0ABN3D3K3_9ACTN